MSEPAPTAAAPASPPLPRPSAGCGSRRLRAARSQVPHAHRRYIKYNVNLRGIGAALDGCKGNRYVTTTHVINSVIVKASKLTKVAKVYRGVAGVLPDRFCEDDARGFRGGVE